MLCRVVLRQEFCIALFTCCKIATAAEIAACFYKERYIVFHLDNVECF